MEVLEKRRPKTRQKQKGDHGQGDHETEEFEGELDACECTVVKHGKSSDQWPESEQVEHQQQLGKWHHPSA